MERAREVLQQRIEDHRGELSLVPDEPYPDERGVGALSSSVTYGFETWGNIFTKRQLLALTTLGRLVREVGEQLSEESDRGLAIGVQTCLALAVDRQADYNSTLCTLNTRGEYIGHNFGRQALPMVWDFIELQTFGDGSGNLDGALDWVFRICQDNSILKIGGQVEQSTATQHPLPSEFAQTFFSDPPYYDAIAYADLSDFFYIWLKRNIGKTYSDLFSTQLVAKTDEIVHLSKRFRGVYDHKTEAYFEENMQKAMAEGKRILDPQGIGVIVFAHKSTAGWEAQLQAMVDAGWTDRKSTRLNSSHRT